MILLSILLVLFSIPANATPAGSGPIEPTPVYGGTVAQPCEWPFVVFLPPKCSGVLIDAQHVLFAAHCGVEFPEVLFGEDISTPSRVVPTLGCEAFPGGEPGQGNDFAICTLAEPQGDIPIIPLVGPAEEDQIRPGHPATIVGFGENEERISGIKRAVDTVVGTTNEAGELRIGGDGQDSCVGDSGGPAVARLDDGSWRIVGITSHGTTCGEGGWYGRPGMAAEWLSDRAEVNACSPLWKPADADSSQWANGCAPTGGSQRDTCWEAEAGCRVSATPRPPFLVFLVFLLVVAGRRRWGITRVRCDSPERGVAGHVD